MEDHTRDGTSHLAKGAAQTEGQGGGSTGTAGWIKGAEIAVLVACALFVSPCPRGSCASHRVQVSIVFRSRGTLGFSIPSVVKVLQATLNK